MAGKRRAQSRNQRGSVIVIALFVMIILSLLGITLLTLSGTESNIAYNALWSEGAFAAAEAGVERGLSQIGPNAKDSITKFPDSGTLSIGTGTYTYGYRSGRKSDTTPTDLVFKGTRNVAGYNLALGTGYNTAGYTFNVYQLNATGMGPRNAQREIEVLAQYGPVAK